MNDLPKYITHDSQLFHLVTKPKHLMGATIRVFTCGVEQIERSCQNCGLVRITVMRPPWRLYRHFNGAQFYDDVEPGCGSGSGDGGQAGMKNKKLMEWWHSHRLGDPYSILVLMFLALDADKRGHGTTSRKSLAREANMPEAKAIDCLINLEKRKLVTADINERGAINYRLNLQNWGDRRK